MSLESVKQKAAQISATVGKAALHALLPDEFEFYSCTLELSDSSGVLIGSLVFPVMPNNVSEVVTPAVNVKKTAGGIVSLVNNNFTPSIISLQGTFGKRFRLLIQQDSILDNSQLSLNNLNISTGGKVPTVPGFNPSFKNGYGILKFMESIIADSIKLDAKGNPKLLFFYNQTLNHNYLVEVTNFTQTQSLESNMLWNYNLEMKTLAKAENINASNLSDKNKISTLMGISVINSGINTILGNLSAVGLKNSLVQPFNNSILAGR